MILVVEDNAHISDALCTVLRYEGFSAVPAYDPIEALAILQTCERPELIVLDLVMPKMDGATFRQRLLDDPKLHDIPIVVMSSVPFWRQKEFASLSGAVSVGRLCDIEELFEAIRDAKAEHDVHAEVASDRQSGIRFIHRPRATG